MTRSFATFSPTKYCSVDQIRDKMDGACSRYEAREK